MATVYSLICWGGKDGKTVTFTDSGDVVNLTNHGLRPGAGVVFSTTGSLPTGLTAGTTYYAKQGADTAKFLLYPTSADAIAGTNQITFSGTGSGTHTAKGAYWSGLTSDQKARYGTAGSERAYNGIKACRDARFSAASAYDTEYIELAEAFDDVVTAALVLNIPAAQTFILPVVAGAVSAAFHGGVVDAGYRVRSSAAFSVALTFSGNRHVARGFSVYTSTNDADLITVSGYYNELNGIIAYGSGVAGVEAFRLAGAANTIVNNIAFGVGDGFYFTGYNGAGNLYANNLSCKNNNGFVLQSGGSEYRGWFYNNMSVGNTTNWGASAPAHSHGMANNYGEAGNAVWFTGTDTSIKTLTADNTTFVDYANNDFRPAAGSPQIDSALVVVGMATLDMIGGLRPNYIGPTQDTVVAAGAFVTGYKYTIVAVGSTDFTAIGASANTVGVVFVATGAGSGTGTASVAAYWDGGPLEYDNGYGNPPATLTIAANVSLVGAEIRIYDHNASGNDLGDELAGTESASGATADYSVGSGNTVWIQIMKDGYKEFGQEYVMPASSTTFTATLRADTNG